MQCYEARMRRGHVIVCLIGLVAATAVRAGDTNAPAPFSLPERRHTRSMVVLPPHVLEALALTPDQQAKYDAIAADFKEDARRWCDANNYDPGEAHEEMHEAREIGDEATVERLASLREGFRDLRRSYADKVRVVLTEKQKATLDKALEHHHNWIGGHDSDDALPRPQGPVDDE